MNVSITIPMDVEAIEALEKYSREYETDLSEMAENFLRNLLIERPDDHRDDASPDEFRSLGILDLLPEPDLEEAQSENHLNTSNK
jgi:hypothetical protein